MRIILLLVFIFSIHFCYSQSILEGVWGLKFGMSDDSVKTIITKKTGKKPKLSDDGGVFTYNDCEIGNRNADVIKLMFWEHKFYGAKFYFIPKLEPEILSLYNSIKSDITTKWWNPQISTESYKSPYSKGDGYEHSAIKLGYATIGAVWYFPESIHDDSNGVILIVIEPEMWVELTYFDGVIHKQVSQVLKKNKMDDF